MLSSKENNKNLLGYSMQKDQTGIFKIIWTKRVFIFLFVFITTSISVGVSFLLPKWYKASATIMTQSSSSSIFDNMSTLTSMSINRALGGFDNQNRFISILKSRTILDKVIDKFDFKQKYKTELISEIRERLKNNLKVDLGDELQINVIFYDKDQDQVADILNYIIYCLDSLNIALNTTNGYYARLFIESRVNEIIDSLKYLESEVIDFMRENNVLNLEAQVTTGVTQYAELKSKIILKEIELAVAKQMIAPDNPQILRIKTEMELLKEQLQSLLTSGNDIYPDFRNIPEISVDMAKFERQVEYYTTIMQFLGPQYENAKIEEKRDIPSFQILDKAVRPEKKARPKKSKIVITVFLSSIIICFYAIYIKEKVLKDRIIGK